MVVEDMKVGEGKTAESQDTVTMKYVGRLEDGTQFDASSRFKFTIDAGEVIKGWDRGVKGMKKGGKRKLTIPPKLGYGKRGSPPEIPPNSTLIFEVELLSIS
ncbi:FKBP-type peptidyl-prolyl cis-trans isomerase [Guillardia theta CCMP2712]|uniref:peptidylprolyl isomerase n=2 Tax=Guillardia theta TaxID=55529 RepID=L1IZX4_GUITC|nr:FKBP-type peptidyl-prolyl cis-trans isomerase [Guillardia theta CCMP2712]EKX41771.1 FKBP-type peptidyl-prolyl cis-trans isomerase [Guillardia theta CCMP2712]|eukprot:XP_005828751.1 FKBP-type peptidyl-prolyl cis-trans isomerase [Guillardia theta CCMP2712]